MSKQTATSRTSQPRARRTARTRRRTAVTSAAVALLAVVVAAGAWAATRDGDTSTGDVLHADTRLGTVELRVSDLDAQQHFYGTVLGLDLLHEADDTVTLGAAGEELIRHIRTSASRPAATEAGLYHSAISITAISRVGSGTRHDNAPGSRPAEPPGRASVRGATRHIRTRV